MLNKRMFIIVSLLLFLLVPLVVLSENVKILSPESTVIIYAGKTNEVKIPIKNEGTDTDTVYISVWPSQWASLEKYWLTLNAGESKLLSFFITPPEDADEGVYVFTISTQSLNTEKNETGSLYLNVKRKTDVFISEIKLDKELVNPGDILEIESVLTNLHKKQKHKVYLTTRILKDELVVKKFDETIELDPKTVKSIKNFYEVEKLQEYGDYTVEIELKDSMNEFLDKEKTEFKIDKHFEMVEHKVREYGLFYTIIVIEVTNEGNIPDSSYTVTESLPKITQYFFYPETEPDSEEMKESRIVYTWELEGIDPGQTKTIRYKLRFINVMITLLMLSILLLFTFDRVTKPALRKKYFGILSGEEELKITLHVKNRRRGVIKDVVVKDVVPSLAKVIRKFDTLTPEIKVRSGGTELIWRIEKLKPGEEILLTYKIKPLIDVIGKLTLPKSYFTYRSKLKRERRVASKSVSITGKIK
ncbi:MAG: hypothetical protein ISS48_01895 [Candidatus Aenigmarchaeota archaeon]|nr:hypothetical protein [Candidatus Aenigmarchaeota archaeon]